MTEAESWTLIGLAFFLAGLVKGVAGAGLPSVAIGVLSLGLDLRVAMALLLAPSFVTNVWQAVAGDRLWAIIRRIWPLLLTSAVATWAGVGVLSRASEATLSVILGLTLAGYAVLGLVRVRLPHPGGYEIAVSLPVGLAHGVLAGMTGSFIPAIPFLQSLGLAKDELVQAMGIVFTVSTVALALAMSDYRLLSAGLLISSAGAVLPALVGMWAGQQVRGRLSEAAFRQALYLALLVLGFYMAWRGLA